ncbi:hypothetical protein ANTPLA_LOCUS8977 [Anthophora plagiata]
MFRTNIDKEIKFKKPKNIDELYTKPYGLIRRQISRVASESGHTLLGHRKFHCRSDPRISISVVITTFGKKFSSKRKMLFYILKTDEDNKVALG